MKQLLFIFLIAFTAQSQAQYWQQKVDYTINVRLTDRDHFLHGYESFVYTNNSPDVLNLLYIHLWPNAYCDGTTALAKQQYQSGDQDLRFGSDSIKGFIDSLDFSVNGVKVPLEYEVSHQDIGILKLPTPLQPGASVTITTPFRVKIPSGEISRLGHVGQSYQITQWYPKPAVYDKDGWHQMPYLNQGEFYSEFGTYDVSITLPKNYVVGATGDLQTEEEIAWLNQKAAEGIGSLDFKQPIKMKGPRTDPFPPSDTEFKTIRYKQQNVHDFAWFADKRYRVLKGEVELPATKRKVTTWAMFTPKNAGLWKNSIEFINDALFYYSKWNGDYPYTQCTAVDGTISAGGGMEYPNVTVIGNSSTAIELEVVIVHEVGHNWFYGILGSNERLHGWMDEGMNTLNELRYMYTKYPQNTNLSDMVMNGAMHFDHLSHYDMADYSYRLIAGLGEDQPIETHSACFTGINYGVVMYMKTGLVFNYLKQYLGDAEFDRCMHAYYEKWKFKHPQPKDMQEVLEKESGKDLSWLFGDLIQTTDHIDYKLKRVKTADGSTSVTVKNVGQVNGPIEIGAYINDTLKAVKWVEPSEIKTTTTFPFEADEIRINSSGRIPELSRENNNWHQSGLFGKAEPPKLQFGIGKNEQGKANLFWTPALGANVYDKFMLGVLIHNYSIPMNKFQFMAAPMYSFGRQSISGIADMNVNFLPTSGLKLSRVGVSVKSFKQTDTVARANDGYYVSVLPYWFAKIGNRNSCRTAISQTILVQGIYRMDSDAGNLLNRAGGYAKYNFMVNKADHKLNIGLRGDYLQNVDSDEYFARASADATWKFRYLRRKKSRWMELRMYGGSNLAQEFIAQPWKYRISLSGANGGQDLYTEDYFFGRTEMSGFWSQQRLENQGAFKSPVAIYANWAATSNLWIQLPVGPKFVGIFADAGVMPVAAGGAEFLWDAGLGIRTPVFSLYFPLVQSDNVLQAYGTLNYTARIRCTVKLNWMNTGVNPGNMM